MNYDTMISNIEDFTKSEKGKHAKAKALDSTNAEQSTSSVTIPVHNNEGRVHLLSNKLLTTSSVPCDSDQTNKLFLGGEWIDIPSILTTDERIFRTVVSKDSFMSLSQTAKDHLNRYLPDANSNNLNEILYCTFTNDRNFFFGNPLDKFFTKIRDGYFTAADHVQLRDHKRVLYDHYIRHYQMNLLKKLLINRHAILEIASKQKPSEPIKVRAKRNCFGRRRLNKHNNVRQRAKFRAKKMIDDCRVKAGEKPGASSDESEPEFESNVVANPMSARSTMFAEKFATDLDLYQPMKMKEFSELYKEYCYLRETEPDCPSLDISDITLEEVYERTGISFQTERNFSKITEQNLLQFHGKRKQQKEKASSSLVETDLNVKKE